MPTINDATVVASAYDTSGNGGRKLVRLSNGWLVAVTRQISNGTLSYYNHLYVSKDNGGSWLLLCTLGDNQQYTHGISIESHENLIFISHMYGASVNCYSFDATTITLGTNITSSTTYGYKVLDTNQSTFNSTSIITNDTGTELHATWASKNATYPNSFNIRYAKYDIAANTWGAVEQRTTSNTAGTDNQNPSIIVKSNGYPSIVYTVNVSSSNVVRIMNWNGTGWNNPVNIYDGGAYAQSSPSAIFVPQSINGLTNGRIHNFWHGTDATDTTAANLRYSYSDDGGITWSPIQKLTSGNVTARAFPTGTANKNNDLFVLVSANGNLSKMKLPNGGSWSTLTTISSPSGHSYPSALFDLSVNFTEPLFIYKDTTKVGFYGTWTVTTISVTQGSIGTKSDKSNLLTYAITTDGTMSTITEKVNGVTVGTKTATSGQSLIAGLTQSQWDAVRFGKYADVTGGSNTITIEMGSEKWTYTFDKRNATEADITSAVKAVKDTNEVYLPAVKSKLASAVRGKGGTVNDSDSFDTMKTAIDNMPVKKSKNGTFTISGASVSITGLGFNPRILNIRLSDSYVYYNNDDLMPGNPNYFFGYRNSALVGVNLGVTKNTDGFSVPLNATNFPNGTWTYQAVE